MERIYINNGWRLYYGASPRFPFEKPGAFEAVRLPHANAMLPYNYAGPEDYQKLTGYELILPEGLASLGARQFATFEGAAHVASIFLNGEKLSEHRCGYTAFTVELTGKLGGGENALAVLLDSRESANVPPFGGAIDYLTYGGLYREAYISIAGQTYISDVFAATPGGDSLSADVSLDGPLCEGSFVSIELLDGERSLYKAEKPAMERLGFETGKLDIESWGVDSPKLYTLLARLVSGGKTLDEKCTRIGFRTAEFRADGFYLNGKPLKLRGLNRHQCYPYIGYAAPASLQRLDAEILKNELRVNCVRTSHYPQSRHFIDRCNELGLLVFTEIPGWQHIGDEEWQRQAIENTREMVLQYRNDPSIICYGVRINESADNDGLYAETNRVAHSLDGTRQTTGVRYIQKSSLLEDFYSYNDFLHSGANAGIKRKSDVSPDMEKGYLITEHNGHMFPTKAFDCEAHRLSQALRHARVLSDACAAPGVAGAIGWCMFDYNTHYDNGSGDGVCYHGVMDMFRNPKLAAALYASQGEGGAVLGLSSTMSVGDHPAANLGEIYAFTNADSVRLYKDGEFVSEFFPDRAEFPGLAHPPVKIDDFIGELIEKNEGLDKKTAAAVRVCLMGIAKYGLPALPASYKLRFALLMAKGLTFADGMRFYGKYIGGWGGKRAVWRFDAMKDGGVAASRSVPESRLASIEVRPSKTKLIEGNSFDMALVRIRALDGAGNPMPYFQEAISMEASGAIKLAGPSSTCLRGGMGGALVQTTGAAGKGELKLCCAGMEESIPFEVEMG